MTYQQIHNNFLLGTDFDPYVLTNLNAPLVQHNHYLLKSDPKHVDVLQKSYTSTTNNSNYHCTIQAELTDHLNTYLPSFKVTKLTPYRAAKEEIMDISGASTS